MSDDHARPRPIIGMNLHPVVKWDDAYRFAANAASALEGTFSKTGDHAAQELHDEMADLLRRIGDKRKEYQDHFDALRLIDPQGFASARDGVVPWPEVERAEGFLPRCTCYDACPQHDRGWEDEACRGRCQPCPQHENAA
jgi:hypothetical protein